MAHDAIGQLLDRCVQREVSIPVERATIDEWCAVFGNEWPECVDDVAPSVMFTTFVRPPLPPALGETVSSGVVLHEELKALLDVPMAIAVGYALKVAGEIHVGDELVSVERIAHLAEERDTRLGPGREWVIEVATSTVTGMLVGVEKFRMLGYRPGKSGAALPRTKQEPVSYAWTEEFNVTAESIRREAAANHVWAGAHHDVEAAQKAGLPDIILDTSSQVARLAGAAQRHRPTERVTGIDLAMKRPILPGATVTLGGVTSDSTTIVTAVVEGREMSRATVTFSG